MRCTERMRETRARHVSARALPPPLHACGVSAQYILAYGSKQTMAEWSLQDLVSPINEFAYQCPTRQTCYQERAMEPPPPPPGLPRRQRPPPAQPQPSTSQSANMALHLHHHGNSSAAPKGDSPRELRNKAEKRRRDRLNQSVAELAAMVPPVVHAHRKMDKTSVLRLTAHYLRAHQHVFGDSIGQSDQEFTPSSMKKILNLFNGFLITVTYKGLFVVVSENVREYLGYSELDLLGQNILGITHEDDRAMLLEQLMPKSQTLGPNGELLIPEEPGAKALVEEGLAHEKRQFIIRFKKHGQRSDPNQYVTCHVQGSFRKSDRACSGPNRCCQVVRRVRARTENPYSSGNDIVFIGIVRPSSETFLNESALESYRMEYRTRHSIDGQIIQCESRIALVTGYMTHEVSGMNAMNFMHRDDVRWVAIALRDMYDTHKLYGESCYRLMTKNGQFIYMRTWGRLIVEDNGACTSFVCTNTVVDEKDGKHLIKLMRKKYTLSVSKVPMPAIEGFEEEIQDEINCNDPGPVEDPRRLKEVILHLVTDLPGPPTEDDLGASGSSTNSASSPSQRFTIIPPKMEVIVSGISKIYDVIKSFDQDQNVPFEDENNSHMAHNRPANGSTYEEAVGGAFQEGKIMDLSSYNSNEVFHFEGPSSSSLACAPIVTEPENIVDTEQGATCLLNEDYFDNLPCGYPSASGINFNNNLNNTYGFEQESRRNLCETNSQLSFFPFKTSPEEVAFFEMLPEPSMINYPSGLKRPNEYENEDFSYKKKNTEADQHLQPEPEMSAFDASNLESFFDETHLNTQIETAINSLDTIDPTFPNLLVSTDVQDILGQLENERKDLE